MQIFSVGTTLEYKRDIGHFYYLYVKVSSNFLQKIFKENFKLKYLITTERIHLCTYVTEIEIL